MLAALFLTLFVTGSTGFVGRRFLPKLLARLGPTDRVYTLERESARHDDPRVVPLAGDVRDIAAQAAALREAHWVFHLAACATFGAGAHYEEINLRPVEALVALLRESPALQGFVFVSTIGVLDRASGDRVDRELTPASLPHPGSDYGRSKLAAEECVRGSGLPFTIIRPAWVYGAGMRANSHLHVLAALVARRPWAARFAWPGRVPLIHVDDLAAALVRCLDVPAVIGGTYLAVAENRSLGEITAQLHLALHGRTVGVRLPWPRLRSLTARLHPRLPLSINNLFLDYLAADDPVFRRDLLPAAPVPFAAGIAELAAEHSPTAGRWVVTGANSGIGFALVHQILADGCPVVAVDRATDRLTPAPNLEVFSADLTDADAIAALAQKIRQSKGRLRVLINNAGVGFRGGLFDLDWPRVAQTIRVNILGTLQMTHLLKASLVRDGTTIVTIASSVAYHPLPGMSVYAASKAFIQSWSLALGEELRGTNHVVTFSPSGTRTNFQKSGGVGGRDDPSLLAPDVVAREIIAAVHRRRRHRLLGGKSRLLVLLSYALPEAMKLRLWGRLFATAR